ncbi:dialkylrecorsinol condensing enzyme [Cellvibrio polysaccharolyticus]|uniref:dialkylrecorsinol condensing enzyme n=1 Tax=Cellvibrio polysaccharolyticus TaxID=2082724 RepID=UPI002E2D1CE6|nr:dialkylrecorsinol condensing enzyme [Cellvibrio polysaccharolyticus]
MVPGVKLPKRILVLHYSQTGQLDSVVDAILQPLRANTDFSIVDQRIEPETDFPFPWPFIRFINTFPEAAHQRPCALKPFTVDTTEKFDLVILAYQVWFLAPSIPVSSFLQSEQAEILRDTPVVTVIACRNMWLMAQEKVKAHLQRLGARLVGNLALVDEAGTAASFISTPLWVLTGKKGPFPLGIPAAGVARADIDAASRFGDAIVQHWQTTDVPPDERLWQGLGAVRINANLIASEKVATRSFYLWGKLFLAAGGQDAWLRKPLTLLYTLFLLTLILTVVPITAILKRLFAPLMKKRIEQQKAYFAQPSGESFHVLKKQ